MLSDALGKAKWTWLVLVLSAALTTLGSSPSLKAEPPAAAEDDDPAPPPGASGEEGDETPEPTPAVADDDDRAPPEETPAADSAGEEKPPAETPQDDPPQGDSSDKSPGEDKPAAEGTADAAPQDTQSEAPARGPTPAARPGAADAPGQLPEAHENTKPSPIKHGSETIEAAPDTEPTALNGVCPGRTTRDELHRAWGDPKRVDKVAGALRETYEINALGRVRVTVVEDVVDSPLNSV